MLLMLGIGIFLLAAANGAERDLGRALFPAVLIGVTFMIAIAALTLTSLSPAPRFGMQLLCIYYTTFFVLPGFHHVTMNVFPFYGAHYPINVRTTAAWAVLSFFVAVVAGYSIQGARQPRSVLAHQSRRVEIFPNAWLAVALYVLSLLATLMLIRTLGISGLLLTRGSGQLDVNGSVSAGLLVTLPRAIVFMSLVYFVILFRYSRNAGFGLVMLLLMAPIMLLTNWPLALSRFALFGYCLCLLVVMVDLASIKARALLSLGFVVGALLVMPIVNSLTRGGQSLGEIRVESSVGRYFETADYDGFQSVNNAVVAVDRTGAQQGKQLLSAMLFFVPRSVWPTKSDHSGAVAARAVGFSYLNVSQPLPGELYLDFKIWGCLIGGLVLGIALARFDHWVDSHWYTTPKSRLFAGVVVGYSIIFYRGALLGIVSTITLVLMLAFIISRYGMKTTRRGAATADAGRPADRRR